MLRDSCLPSKARELFVSCLKAKHRRRPDLLVFFTSGAEAGEFRRVSTALCLVVSRRAVS
jgi:hypothetical protein